MDSAGAKRAAGEAAALWIEEGMLVGLGTGSTALFFIEALAKRCREGLKILAAATSIRSRMTAEQLGIPLIQDQTITHLDLAVDGADEIDPDKNMIKGGGGALLREKILAQAAREFIIVVDEKKCVTALGSFPVPVELLPFAYRSTLSRLEKEGYQAILRLSPNHTPYVTDNGNFIADIHFKYPILNPEKEEEKLKKISGILETGFFYRVAGRVIIGLSKGGTEIK